MRGPAIRAGAALLPLLLAGAACPKDKSMTERELRSTDLPPPRDENIAVQEELETARRAGTRAAYDLFIARHPGHPLVATAERERAALPRRPQG